MTLVMDVPIAAPVEQKFTPEDVERLENEGLYELVGGRLVEKQMSYLANKTAGIILRRIGNYLEESNLPGDVLPETTFQVFAIEADRIRRPDIAVLVGEHIPVGEPPRGALRVRPDIAIEIVSPSDRIYDLDEKLEDYRLAGIPLVWVINPVSRVVRIHRPDRMVTELNDTDTITGEGVLPGFAVPVSSILPPK